MDVKVMVVNAKRRAQRILEGTLLGALGLSCIILNFRLVDETDSWLFFILNALLFPVLGVLCLFTPFVSFCMAIADEITGRTFK